MPYDLAQRAKRNLAQADAQISKFNDIANRVSRIPFKISDPSYVTPEAPASFKFNLAGTPDTSLGVQPVQSFNATQPNVQANGADNWRFRSFGDSQLSNGNGDQNWRFAGFNSNLDKSVGTINGAYRTSPNAYKTNPAAYNQIASSPVVPAGYQPKDITQEQRQYGWGSALQEEED